MEITRAQRAGTERADVRDLRRRRRSQSMRRAGREGNERERHKRNLIKKNKGGARVCFGRAAEQAETAACRATVSARGEAGRAAVSAELV